MQTVYVTCFLAGQHGVSTRGSAARWRAASQLADELSANGVPAHPVLPPEDMERRELSALVLRVKTSSVKQAREEAASTVELVAKDLELIILRLEVSADPQLLAS